MSRSSPRSAVGAAAAEPELVGGVEEHHAAMLQIVAEALLGRGGERRLVGGHAPIEDREEGELVGLEIDADGIAQLGGGALRDHQAEAEEARLADAVALVIAGDDIGEPRGAGGIDGEFIGIRRLRPRRRRQQQQEQGKPGRRHARPGAASRRAARAAPAR